MRPLRQLSAAFVFLMLIVGSGCGGAEEGPAEPVEGDSTDSQVDGEANGGLETMIEGTIRVEGADAPTTVIRLRVQIRDVSLADGPSEIIAERTYADVTLTPGESIRFDIALPAVSDQPTTYSLFVHADSNGSDDISVGDFITTAMYTVAVDGSQEPLEVVIQLVTS